MQRARKNVIITVYRESSMPRKLTHKRRLPATARSSDRRAEFLAEVRRLRQTWLQQRWSPRNRSIQYSWIRRLFVPSHLCRKYEKILSDDETHPRRERFPFFFWRRRWRERRRKLVWASTFYSSIKRFGRNIKKLTRLLRCDRSKYKEAHSFDGEM